MGTPASQEIYSSSRRRKAIDLWGFTVQGLGVSMLL